MFIESLTRLQAKDASAAIEEGRFCREAPSMLKSALDKILPPPLLAIIANYVYVPINQAPTNS